MHEGPAGSLLKGLVPRMILLGGGGQTVRGRAIGGGPGSVQDCPRWYGALGFAFSVALLPG